MEQVDVSLLKDGKKESTRHEASKGGVEDIKISEHHLQREGARALRVEKELNVPKEGVRVGDIVVELGTRK
ncbi:hypothetical protein L195_g063398, partial [Trifolium pratense]